MPIAVIKDYTVEERLKNTFYLLVKGSERLGAVPSAWASAFYRRNPIKSDNNAVLVIHEGAGLMMNDTRKACGVQDALPSPLKANYQVLKDGGDGCDRGNYCPLLNAGKSAVFDIAGKLAFGIYFTPDPIPHPMISGATTDHIGSEVLGISLSTCPISELKQGGGNIASGCRSDDEVQLLTPVTRSEFDIHLSEGALYFWANQPRISSLDGLWVLGRGVEPEARLVWRGLGTAQE
ncbi:hypothetical protein J3A83DRAFT_4187746 [Scleroderma citrinum]